MSRKSEHLKTLKDRHLVYRDTMDFLSYGESRGGVLSAERTRLREEMFRRWDKLGMEIFKREEALKL